MIAAESLSKSFGSRKVLDGATFGVPEGEVFGLVGTNGSGKTVIMKILATLLVPESGDASIGGVSVVEDPDKVKEMIGYVPESFGVYPRLTAQEYLEFYAGIHGLPRSQRRRVSGELLALVDLAELRDDDVELMSPGQKQRLCLARAMVHDPKVLLIDDISKLDVYAQVEFRDLVRELQRIGKTIVVTSHHLRELEELCTWIGLIEAGSMVAVGPLAQVKRGAEEHRRIIVGLAGEAGEHEGDMLRAVGLMEGFRGVEHVEARGDGIEAKVDRSFVDHELLALLVASGLKVRSLSDAGDALGQAFLRLTKGTSGGTPAVVSGFSQSSG